MNLLHLNTITDFFISLFGVWWPVALVGLGSGVFYVVVYAVLLSASRKPTPLGPESLVARARNIVAPRRIKALFTPTVDFTSIDKPSVQERLSYYGRQVKKSADEYNNALPGAPDKSWHERHMAISILFGEAQRDARDGIHKNGEPLWSVDVNTAKDGNMSWYPALDRASEGDVLCYLLQAQEELGVNREMIYEETPESLKLLNELVIAEKNCLNGRKWD